MIEVPEISVHDKYTLTGTHQAGVNVHAGGELILSGIQQGTVQVESGGVVVVHGVLQGTLHVERDASVVVDGKLQGTTHVEAGGSVAILSGGQSQGTIHNEGSFVNEGVRGGAVSGNPIDDRPGGSVKSPNADGIYFWRE
ncbi:MAG: hypothetical protein ABIP33_10170 [Pseudolysinimonas sp.]